MAAHITTAEYGQIVDLCPGVKLRFVDAGHLLGSASVELCWRRTGWRKRLSFPGTLATSTSPSFGTRSPSRGRTMWSWRAPTGTGTTTPSPPTPPKLAKIIDDTFSKGGNVIIPSFAVGRTQELLYFMREMKKEGW